MSHLLEVKNLTTAFTGDYGTTVSVDHVSFHVDEGEVVSIVGESGCGKSVTSLSIMGLLGRGGSVIDGSVLFDGKELLTMSEKELDQIRGNELTMIFQDPLTSLNPVFTIGSQMMESIRIHMHLSKKEAAVRAESLLARVGMPDPHAIMKKYPHPLSGGMRQRVMIAMALACNPRLLIADEPTTALDVTVQAQVLELLKELQRDMDTAILLITHNLGVVWEMCDKVMVMYAGNTVEFTDTKTLYSNPRHPYTWGLLDSMPKLSDESKGELKTIPGTPPDLRLTGKCCNFYNRCPYVTEACTQSVPPLVEVEPGHFVACHRQNLTNKLEKGEGLKDE